MRIGIGNRISWIAAGKVARLEGKAGKRVTGTVTGVDKEGISVMADHRLIKGADFYNMGSFIPGSEEKNILLISR